MNTDSLCAPDGPRRPEVPRKLGRCDAGLRGARDAEHGAGPGAGARGWGALPCPVLCVCVCMCVLGDGVRGCDDSWLCVCVFWGDRVRG